jgi:hypothetical protein
VFKGECGQSSVLGQSRIFIRLFVAAAIVFHGSIFCYCATLDEVRAAWIRHTNSVQSIQFIYHMDRTDSYEDMGEANSSENDKLPTHTRSNVTFSISGNKIAYDRTTEVLHNGQGLVLSPTQRSCFDGNETRMFMPSAALPMGRITDGKNPADNLGNNFEFVPIWLTCDPVRLIELTKRLSIDTMVIDDAPSFFDGRTCIGISFGEKSNNNRLQARVYVGPENEFRPIGFRESSGNVLRIEHVVAYKPHAQLGSALAKWTSNHFAPSGKLENKIVATVDECRANKSLDESVFVLPFPKGTLVLKLHEGQQLGGGKHFIQIDEQGTLEPLTDEQYRQRARVTLPISVGNPNP